MIGGLCVKPLEARWREERRGNYCDDAYQLVFIVAFIASTLNMMDLQSGLWTTLGCIQGRVNVLCANVGN